MCIRDSYKGPENLRGGDIFLVDCDDERKIRGKFNIRQFKNILFRGMKYEGRKFVYTP